MKREHWKCPGCGTAMEDNRNGYMLCPKGHAKLRPLWGVNDLQLAKRVDYKRFIIGGVVSINNIIQYWEYVPHAHEGCLSRAPEPGTIVAKVACGRGLMYRRAMTFRPSKQKKKK
jgi:hypothetical protein